MRVRSLRFYLIAAAVAGIFSQALTGLPAAAQKKGTLVWEQAVVIERVKKPNRAPTKTAPKTERVPLLTLQWSLLERDRSNVPIEVSPKKVFRTKDQVRLAITANQSGYLYVITRSEDNDGVMLFPDPNIDNGKNLIAKNKAYIVPSYCPGYPDPYDCWWEMMPPAGRETLIVIFSRDKITTLPSDVSEANAPVSRQAIEDIISTSKAKTEHGTGSFKIPGQPATRFATRVQNTNQKDNEELIAIIEINHAE